ncbi:MAG TPA: transcription elongation factor GreA [Candidatus Limnocylindrales bacterium]|nr:transcription elongation factor GreA [Candidatus Limnocylindrales bacterium]
MTSASDLLTAVGLATDGLALLGRPVASRRPGVFLIELVEPLPKAPIELSTIGKWIERVPSLRLDGEVPTSRALRARLEAFWIPSATVLFIGTSERTLAGRIRALEAHVLGDARPHAASQWLRTLSVTGLRVRWAETDAPEEYEDALLDAFGASVPPEERSALPDQSIVLPFANLRRSTGERKATGITGSTLPVEREPAPIPTRLVELPQGDADGARNEERGSGTRRRTNTTAPRTPRASPRSRPAPPVSAIVPVTPRRIAARTTAAGQGRPQPAATRLTSDGLERLRAELDQLTRERRPEVIDRIRRARELGDLKENADYQAAREEQSFLEGRIQALEARLRSAVIVAPTEIENVDTTHPRIGLGSRVTVEIGGEELVFTIVGPTESDPTAGRISDASPVGRALVGASAGDEVSVRTPRGEARYRVLALG